jgi:hypothetical protein
VSCTYYDAYVEVWSARSFIKRLQIDINVINAPDATNLLMPTHCSESCVCGKLNGISIPVVAA